MDTDGGAPGGSSDSEDDNTDVDDSISIDSNTTADTTESDRISVDWDKWIWTSHFDVDLAKDLGVDLGPSMSSHSSHLMGFELPSQGVPDGPSSHLVS